MRKYPFLSWLVLLTLAGCSALPKLPFQAPSALSPCPGLKIGILIGEESDPIAAEQRDGYDLALEQANVDGGPSGCKLSVVYVPETVGGSPNQVYRAVRSMVEEEKVIAILGGTTSTSSMFAASLVNRFAIPMIIPNGGGLHVLPDNNHWTFRLDPNDELYSQTAFEMIKKELGTDKQVTIVFENTTPGHDAAVIAAQTAAAQQLSLMEYLAVDSGQAGLDALFSSLQENPPDVLYMIFNQPSQVNSLLKALADRRLAAPFTVVQGSGFGSRAFLESSGGTFSPFAEGLILTTPWIAKTETDAGQRFLDDFASFTRQKRGQAYQPTAYSAEAYQALRLIDSVIRGGSAAWNGTTVKDIQAAREILRGEIQSYRENTPTWGSISFATGGQNQSAIYLQKMTGGKLVPIDLSEPSSQKPDNLTGGSSAP